MAYKRIVVKIGTNLITGKSAGIRKDFIRDIARQISSLKKGGLEFLIVTSGAIGAGSREIGIKKSREIDVRQALAACGQSAVMGAYHEAFSKHKVKVAQILVTYEDFSDRKRYLNLRNTINKLMELKVIPVINENDALSVEEIGHSLGDNDKLSALVASKINADLLIMLSDIEGLYDRNPKTNRDAKLIRSVTRITREIEKSAGRSGSEFSIGGMATKINAAKIAIDSGFDMVICNGKKDNIISKAISGKEGTLFLGGTRIREKERWIRFSDAKGKIIADKGAEDALKKRKSLLSVGIVRVEGDFKKNSIIMINDIAKGITDFSSDELEKMKGRKGKIAVKSENIVLI
ncbi:glutamate 5-kinase [Candidatus Woesearchaeota archaeon]|nr:glutamate 5-kinase [Candidatus Woesearchaeota archaeon]